MDSRRQFLAAAVTTSVATLAGCTSGSSQRSSTCTTTPQGSSGPVFADPPTVSSDDEQEWLVLFVPIDPSAPEEAGVRTIRVFERDELTHEFPVESVENAQAEVADEDDEERSLVAQQTLGRVPGSGSVEVRALDDEDEVLETAETSYSCQRGDLEGPSFS